MGQLTMMSEDERQKFGMASRLLSHQFSPDRWAETVIRTALDFSAGR
jgi:hypothetical protein